MPTTDTERTPFPARTLEERGRTRSRRFAPVLGDTGQPLEPRVLTTVVVLKDQVFVTPTFLPPTGRTIPVTVFGQLISTKPVIPAGFFHVTDEYRRVEPFGPVTLTPAGMSGPNYRFTFRFQVPLLAQRSTNTPDGRHYYIVTGASDVDGNGATTVAVYVPKTYPPPGVRPATPVVAGPRALMRRA